MSASHLPLKTLVLGLSLGLALSGCGVKGPLEPPPSATPEQKTSAKADPSLGELPTLGKTKAKKTAPTEAPNQPFLLDFLL